MSKLNKKTQTEETKFEPTGVRLAGGLGQRAARQTSYELLRRCTLASLLWENLAYESGDENARNIKKLIPKVEPKKVAELALECRQKQKLRHIPLFIAREMARHTEHNKLLADLLPNIITRADQLTDFVSLYFKDGKQPLTAKVKQGLAKAFHNFNEYHFAKYDRQAPVRLRDVLFLTHPKPSTKEQAELFKKIADCTLPSADTWEVALSGGEDKKETFTRLINEKRLGGLAFLRNLRNMVDAGVDYDVLKKGFDRLSSTVLLPLNYYAAATHNPTLTREIEDAMLKSYQSIPKLPGHTVYVVDVSGSMGSSVSGKSAYTRYEVAFALCMLAAEMSERVSIFVTAGSDMRRTHKTEQVRNLRGFGLVELLKESVSSMGGGGIFTTQCVNHLNEKFQGKHVDRMIIFSDSADCDYGNAKTPKFFADNNYIIDVSAHKHGVNYKGTWTAEISGWSEHFLTYIAALEGVESQFESDN